MRCRVLLLRRDGRRLPWRHIDNGPSVEGDLNTHYLSLPGARYFVAKLVARGCALQAATAELYEPVLTTIGNGPMVLRGFEREGEAATVQEWRCEVVLRLEHHVTRHREDSSSSMRAGSNPRAR